MSLLAALSGTEVSSILRAAALARALGPSRYTEKRQLEKEAF